MIKLAAAPSGIEVFGCTAIFERGALSKISVSCGNGPPESILHAKFSKCFPLRGVESTSNNIL